MKTKELKNKRTKRTILIVLLVALFLGVVAGGYFLCRYLFPSEKELFLIAHKNTLELMESEPENFKNTKNISFLTEILSSGGYLEDNEKEIYPLSFVINSTENRDNNEYNVSVKFNEKEILKSTKVEVDDVEVLTIPKLSDKSLASDSYEDVLSFLLGADVYKNVDLSEDIDEEQFKIYLLKYAKKIYENIPEESFVLTESESIKQIMLNANLSDITHSVLEEMKKDTEFREFMYEQTKTVTENINKKYPYTTEFLKVEDKEEYFKNFDEKIDEFIKNTQNSTIRVKTLIDNKKRVVLEENVTVEDEKYEQLTIYYGEMEWSVFCYDKYDTLFSMHSTKEENGSEIKEKIQISFNVTENREQTTESQKLFITTIESTTDTENLKEILLPDEYYDIKNMSQEEKRELSKTAKENFNAVMAEVMSGLIK